MVGFPADGLPLDRYRTFCPSNGVCLYLEGAVGVSNPRPNWAWVSCLGEVEATQFQLFVAEGIGGTGSHDARDDSIVHSRVDLACISFVAAHDITLDVAADELSTTSRTSPYGTFAERTLEERRIGETDVSVRIRR